MDTFGLVVIGSGPAGVRAARAWLEAGGSTPVLLVSADRDEPYERPPLSKEVLAGDTQPEGSPIDGKPLPNQVELRLGQPVSQVDTDARTVTVGGEQVGYGQLVLASGSRPRSLPSADADADVHLLRSLDDAQRLVAAAGHARTALVLGSGFIGCEAAASLARRGVTTTLVSPEKDPQVDRLGTHAADAISGWLTGLGVALAMETEVSSIRAPRQVHLSDGTTHEPDLLLVAVGVEPSSDYLDGTALQQHEGRVVADEHLHAAPGVWVAGDLARAMHPVAGRPIPVEHWGDALAMGELAGANAATAAAAGSSDKTEGKDAWKPWDQVPGFWSTIGEHTLQYAAWGDGHDEEVVDERPGRFTVWYGQDGRLVGVLGYNAEDDYERGQALIEQGAELAEAVRGDRPTEAAGESEGESGSDAQDDAS